MPRVLPLPHLVPHTRLEENVVPSFTIVALYSSLHFSPSQGSSPSVPPRTVSLAVPLGLSLALSLFFFSVPGLHSVLKSRSRVSIVGLCLPSRSFLFLLAIKARDAFKICALGDLLSVVGTSSGSYLIEPVLQPLIRPTPMTPPKSQLELFFLPDCARFPSFDNSRICLFTKPMDSFSSPIFEPTFCVDTFRPRCRPFQ